MRSRSRSILRYPGSKARFANFIAAVHSLNKLSSKVFIEPFCGGSSVSIALLEDGVVNQVALNDADPLIAALWDVVFSDDGAKWLSDKVLTIPLTIEEWKRQKASNPKDRLHKALKGLYLNRTSFNGIIHRSGPIGGWKQEKRTVSARFNREKLSNRILELSLLSDKIISVDNRPWKEFIERMLLIHPDAFVYFDPPYYHKAEQLYGHIFDEFGHADLRKWLGHTKANWLLSYDDVPEVRKLYSPEDFRGRVIDSTYSAHPIGGGSFVGRELIYTNLLKLPAVDSEDAVHMGITVRRLVRSLAKGPVRLPISQEAIDLISV